MKLGLLVEDTVQMPQVAVYIKNIIDEICVDIANGDEIKWEAIDQELRWVWTNKRTGKQWSFNIRVFKRVMNQDPKDPRLPLFAKFVSNTAPIPEIQKDLNRLENLKAFW